MDYLKKNREHFFSHFSLSFHPSNNLQIFIFDMTILVVYVCSLFRFFNVKFCLINRNIWIF